MELIDREGLASLVAALRQRGYRVIGPTVREGAVVYSELTSAAELPAGWTDEQEAGVYRLVRRADGALFGHGVGPHSWKRYLFPPAVRLFRAERNGDGNGFAVAAESRSPSPDASPYAFLGVRACELAAMAVQDRVFAGGAHADPLYCARRREAFVVAVSCTRAGGTCFCTSMGTGPRVESGYDLALTELAEAGRHLFLIAAGSERGSEVLEELPRREASADEVAAADRAVERAAASMGRSMDTAGIAELLGAGYEHPRWDGVAERCLSCGNCTLVCPTCFCSTVEETSDLAGRRAERWRRWDSCFSVDFSYLHGGSVRPSVRSRYRQWLTHKLGTWVEQFGTSGCVGCGRCITWCPVGIDITEEIRALRGEDGAADGAGEESPHGDP